MALLRQGGGEGAAVGLPLVVGAAHGLLALEVRDNPACAQDGGLARSNVVRANLLAYLIGLAIGVAEEKVKLMRSISLKSMPADTFQVLVLVSVMERVTGNGSSL